MLLLPTDATVVDKNQHFYGLTLYHTPCTTHPWRLQIMSKILIHASGCIIINIDSEEVTENLEWEGVIGSLTSATCTANFNLTMNLKLTRLLSHGVQSVLSFWRCMHYIVGKTRDFPWSKNKQSNSCFWGYWQLMHVEGGLDLRTL